VTHDQTEAMTLGHRVAVMRDGRIVQVDVPQRLYQDPKDLFVATFIGSPSMNLVEANLDSDHVSFGQFQVPLDPGRRPRSDVDQVVLGIRPEAFDDASRARAQLPRIEVMVDVLEELGSDAFVFFHIAAPRVTIDSRVVSEDDASLLAEEDAFFTARVQAMTSARVGAPLQLAVDPSTFHFFDTQTGKSLLAVM
jgi:multiple sugar transport system ATP-binding protein